MTVKTKVYKTYGRSSCIFKTQSAALAIEPSAECQTRSTTAHVQSGEEEEEEGCPFKSVAKATRLKVLRGRINADIFFVTHKHMCRALSRIRLNKARLF